ncbi:hypothetical protein RHDC4_01492 [Rhodocyclaceae bacterium]|nr:hypothetical protein RHDC4_01492 [Rhodocyclaceae bacterium]
MRQFHKVMAHECILHHSLLEMLGNYGFAKLRAGIEALEAAGDPVITELAQNVAMRYGPLSPDQKVGEIVAAAGERCLDEHGDIEVGFGFMKGVFAGITNWLRDHGIPVRFTNLELQGLMHEAGQWIKSPEKVVSMNCGGDDRRSARGAVVMNGRHSGRILDIDDGLAVQKVGRGNEQVTHSLARLSRQVAVGDVVDIAYHEGRGEVVEPGRVIER